MANTCITPMNMGLSRCNNLPQMPKCIIETPDNFFATPAQAIDADFWQDAMLDVIEKRIFLWPPFFDFKDNSEKAVYQTTPLGVEPVRDGRYDFEFEISQNLCLHKAAFTHRSKNRRVFLYDVKNQLLGTSDANGNFSGFKYLILNTEKLMLSNGTVATQSPGRLVLADNLELDQNGTLLAASFVESLTRLIDVTITLVSAAANKIVVTIKQTCDGTNVNGLVKADFVLTTAAGVDQTSAITGSVVEVDGTYTLTCTGAVTGFINLVPASTLSIEGYEAVQTTLTIPFP